MQRFKNKNVLITGAANGIGRATALRIAQEGGNIGLLDRDAKKLGELAKQLEENYSSQVTFIKCDVADFEETQTAINYIAKCLGGIQVLSHNAGILRCYHTHEMTAAQWDELLSINLTGTFNVNRHVLPYLLKNETSYLVNTSSNSADYRHPWLAAYAATKGAIKSFTRSLHIEYCRQGLRANCVMPGSIESQLASTFKIPEGADPELIKSLDPRGVCHMVSAEHVASTIAFLASDDAYHINGTEITVDGGKFF